MFDSYIKLMRKKFFLFGWKGLFSDILNAEFSKFCIVGTLGASFNYSIFFLLFHFFDVYYVIASGTGLISAAFISFTLNKIFTFKGTSSQRNDILKYLLKYISVIMISLFAGINFLRFIVDTLNVNPYISNIFTIGLTTIINFTGSKYYAFKG